MKKSVSTFTILLLLGLHITFGQAGTPFTYKVNKMDLQDNSVNFQSNAPQGAISFFWEFNSGEFTSTEENPTIASGIISQGKFQVLLSYQYQGEKVSIVETVDIENISKTILHPNKTEVIELRDDKKEFDELPNVFTPNGDGDNDYLEIKPTDSAWLKFRVFSRSGMMVHEQEGSIIQWDGKNYYGQDVPDGIYYYVLKDLEGNYNPTKGFFYIYR